MTWQERTKQHEGLRLKPYKDTVGKLTIGYGRNLDDNGVSISEANLMFDNDCAGVIREVNRNILWIMDVDEVRRGIIYEMAFNLGINRLLLFKKMLSAIRDKNYDAAASEMLNSVWAVQVGVRATELASLMRG